MTMMAGGIVVDARRKRDEHLGSRDIRLLDRANIVALVVLTAAAAAARFAVLAHQSLWYDEIVSATLAKQSFGAMLHDIARTESTPPLYYIVLWIWTRAFGTTTTALRSLSACVGVLTVMVVFAAARVRFSRRAAIAAGAVAAFHPMLIWYSQEARAYALVTLFVALSLYYLLRAQSAPTTATLAGWAIAASLGLATHYFAVFVVLPEAAVLLYVLRSQLRRVVAAVAVPAAVGAALLPLAIHQRDTGHTTFVAALPLKDRVQKTVNQLVLGNYGVSGTHLIAVCLVIAVVVALAIALRAEQDERRDGLLLLLVAAAGFLLPLVLTTSAFYFRNLIVVLPPLVLLVGLAAGLRAGRARATVVVCAAALALLLPSVKIERDRGMQREDWRDAAALIGPREPERAILTYPRFEYIALTHYRPDLRVVSSGKLRVRELLLVGRMQLAIRHLPAGFRRVADERVGTLRLVTLRSATPVSLDVASLHLQPELRILEAGGFRTVRGAQDATLLVDR